LLPSYPAKFRGVRWQQGTSEGEMAVREEEEKVRGKEMGRR